MNIYRHKRTGAEVVTASVVTGDDWELVKPKKKNETKETKETKEANEDKNDGGDGA